MAEPSKKKLFYSKEEYLEMEAAADFKSDFYQGEIFAMSAEVRDTAGFVLI